jgi:hypothetical protein
MGLGEADYQVQGLIMTIIVTGLILLTVQKSVQSEPQLCLKLNFSDSRPLSKSIADIVTDYFAGGVVQARVTLSLRSGRLNGYPFLSAIAKI